MGIPHRDVFMDMLFAKYGKEITCVTLVDFMLAKRKPFKLEFSDLDELMERLELGTDCDNILDSRDYPMEDK